MNVMNRKLFANRDARRKLASMGGIVTSSPELINTVQSFRRGGRTITFGNTKLVLFDDGEMYAELEDGRRVKLNEAQKAEINALLEIRNERLRDEVLEKGATAEGPSVFADTLGDIGSETISPEVRQEVDKQSQVLDVLRRGKGIRQAVVETGLNFFDVVDIAAGALGLGFNKILSLGTEGLATALNAAGFEKASRTAAEQAGELREAGRDFFFKEGDFNVFDGSTYPKVVGIPGEILEKRADEREIIKQTSDVAPGVGPVKGALTTPEQRAEIAAQSDAAIKRASPETLRDTGESVGFTGRTDLLSATPKSGVMSSLDGSEVLFDLLQGGDTVPDKTASVGFEGGDRIAPPVRSPSGFGEGIMSQAPGISVPNVDIGEAGLEKAREIAERDAAIKNYLATGPRDSYRPPVITNKQLDPFGGYGAFLGSETNRPFRPSPVDMLDAFNQGEIYKDDSRTQEARDAVLDILNKGDGTFPTGRNLTDKAMLDVDKRAIDFIKSDTYTPPSEIYSDLLGGDPRAIARYQESTPEEVQAISDRLAREAAAEEAAKEQGFFTEQDEAIQSEFDEANAKQQAMLDADADAASLEDLKTTAEEIEEKTEKVEPKKTTTEPGKVEPGDRGFDPKETETVIEELDKAVDKENKKTGGGSPASAGADVFFDAVGVDSSNMTLKEKVTSMKEIYTDLLGYDDEEESELFWLNMAQIGFLVASGQDPNALANIAAGFAQGASKFAQDKRDKKARDDKFTLAAFGEVMDDERARRKFGYDKKLAEIRASGTSPYGKRTDPLTLAFRMAQNAKDNFEFDSIEEALEHFKGVVGKEYGIDLGGKVNPDYTPKTAEELNTAAINRGDKTFVYNGKVYPVVTG